MEKLEILPQVIFKFKCLDEDLISNILLNLKQENWHSNLHTVRLNSSVQTINNNLHKDVKYEKLFEWFHKCLNDVKNELNLNCEQLKICLSWGNKSGYNCWHHQHTHSNSFISGILYLTDSNSKTWFSIKNIWNMKSGNGYSPILVTPENLDLVVHKEDTITANLIVFPSSLKHSVDEHKDESSERYSISFNCFPSGRIVNAKELHTIEINVL